jgi:hypothetical protein
VAPADVGLGGIVGQRLLLALLELALWLSCSTRSAGV